MSYYVLYDDPRMGGDGTFLTEDDPDDIWSHDRERARIMTQTEAELALEDVDGDECFRHRFIITHISVFNLPIGGWPKPKCPK